jgi:hypothetical protein
VDHSLRLYQQGKAAVQCQQNVARRAEIPKSRNKKKFFCLF